MCLLSPHMQNQGSYTIGGDVQQPPPDNTLERRGSFEGVHACMTCVYWGGCGGLGFVPEFQQVTGEEVLFGVFCL